MEVVNINEKFSKFSDHWNPRIAGSLNGQHVKLVKIKGDFIWHSHVEEDEMFLVMAGTLHMDFRDKSVVIQAGEFIIVPRGVEHRPWTEGEEEVQVMLFEPDSTVNTGAIRSDRTREKLEEI